MARRFDRHPIDLAIAAAATLVAVALWLQGPGQLTFTLGALYLFFVPGYTLLFAFNPARGMGLLPRVTIGTILGLLIAGIPAAVLQVTLDDAGVHQLLGYAMAETTVFGLMGALMWYRMDPERRWVVRLGGSDAPLEEQAAAGEATRRSTQRQVQRVQRQVTRADRQVQREADRALKRIERRMKRLDKAPPKGLRPDQDYVAQILRRMAADEAPGTPEELSKRQRRLIEAELKKSRRGARAGRAKEARRRKRATQAEESVATIAALLPRLPLDTTGAEAALDILAARPGNLPSNVVRADTAYEGARERFADRRREREARAAEKRAKYQGESVKDREQVSRIQEDLDKARRKEQVRLERLAATVRKREAAALANAARRLDAYEDLLTGDPGDALRASVAALLASHLDDLGRAHVAHGRLKAQETDLADRRLDVAARLGRYEHQWTDDLAALKGADEDDNEVRETRARYDQGRARILGKDERLARQAKHFRSRADAYAKRQKEASQALAAKIDSLQAEADLERERRVAEATGAPMPTPPEPAPDVDEPPTFDATTESPAPPRPGKSVTKAPPAKPIEEVSEERIQAVIDEILQAQQDRTAAEKTALDALATRLKGVRDVPEEDLDADIEALDEALQRLGDADEQLRLAHARAIRRIQRQLAHIEIRRRQRESAQRERLEKVKARHRRRREWSQRRIRRAEDRARRAQDRAIHAATRPGRLDPIIRGLSAWQRRQIKREERAVAAMERRLNRLEDRARRRTEREESQHQAKQDRLEAKRQAGLQKEAAAEAQVRPDVIPDDGLDLLDFAARDEEAAQEGRLEATRAEIEARRDEDEQVERRTLRLVAVPPRLRDRLTLAKTRLARRQQRLQDAYATIVSETPEHRLGALLAEAKDLESLQYALAALANRVDREQERQRRLEERLQRKEDRLAGKDVAPRGLVGLMAKQISYAARERRALTRIEEQLTRMLAVERGEGSLIVDPAERHALRLERRRQRRARYRRARLEQLEQRAERMRLRREAERLRRRSMPVPVTLQVNPREARRVLITLWGYIALIGLAEAVTANFLGPFTFGNGETAVQTGIALHVGILFALILHGYLHVRDSRTAFGPLLVAMMMAPLIRIFSLSMPVVTFSFVQWFTLIGIPLYIALFAIIRAQRLDLEDIGLRWPEPKWFGLEAAVVFWSIFFGAIEHIILRPNTLFPSLELAYVVAPVFALFVSTGLFEELLFRGVLQRHALRVVRPQTAFIAINVLFGVLHIGNHSIADVILVFFVGWVYSQVVFRTRSLVGVSIGHTVANVMLFIVGPYAL